LNAIEKEMLASPNQRISLTDPDSRSMATSRARLGRCWLQRAGRRGYRASSDRHTGGDQYRLGVEVITFNANAEDEFEGIFATMAQRQVEALLVGGEPLFNSRRAHLIALAAQHRLPAIYEWREFALDGGLMSYGTVLADAYSQAGNYAGRILKGEKPGDLPVVLPTKYQFVINLKTAKALGLEFSPMLSARADEVIE